MMSVNQWLLLCLVFTAYLFLGATLFYTIERRYEESRLLQEPPSKLDFEELMERYYTYSNNKAHREVVMRLKKFCNANLFKKDSHYLIDAVYEETEDEFQWSFFNSFFFSLTTLSTIGYGNLHPTSWLGRMLVILYSLVGIPLNGIVLSSLGEFFGSTFIRAHEKYKVGNFDSNKFVLFLDICTYLVPGILLFIFLPSGFFVYFEGWTFEESIYFAYVTLTTIGYGDFVAGQKDNPEIWYNVYKVVLIIWILFGLGYLLMILNFISLALRCNKMGRLERKIVRKVCSGFSRDLTYIRRMLNETYLLRFKPVYQDEKPEAVLAQLNRSQSAPNLSKWPVLERIPKEVVQSSSEDEEETRQQFEKLKYKRRRGLSENIFKYSALRVRSESDLTKIDKVATFNTASHVERKELLARVVDAFETTYSMTTSSSSLLSSDDEEEKLPPKKISRFERELNGIHGFSNDEILSSEWTETNNDWDIIKTTSLCEEKVPAYCEQWTWPGSEGTGKKIPNFKLRIDQRLNSIPQDSTKERQNGLQLPGVQSIRRMSMAAINFISSSKLANKIISSREDEEKDPEQKPREMKTRRTGKQTVPRKHAKKRYSFSELDYNNMRSYMNYYTQTKMKEAKILNLLKNRIGNLDNSSSASPVLEQTSLGDFLRIVNSLHTTSNYYSTLNENPRARKVGEASPLFTLFQSDAKGQMANEKNLDKMSRERRNSVSKRRYSLAPMFLASNMNVSRNTSFSNNVRKLSPSRFLKKRTYSIPALSFSQTGSAAVSHMRSESISENIIENDQPSLNPFRSQKIRRFSVKPVILPSSMPEIVVSDASNDTNPNQQSNVQVHVDGSTLESVLIDKL